MPFITPKQSQLILRKLSRTVSVDVSENDKEKLILLCSLGKLTMKEASNVIEDLVDIQMANPLREDEDKLRKRAIQDIKDTVNAFRIDVKKSHPMDEEMERIYLEEK